MTEETRLPPASRAARARGSTPIRVRLTAPGDAGQISRLCFETVHHVNARDYSPRQIHAWAPRIRRAAWWHRRWRQYTVLVAIAADRIVGFAELDPPGHIDCFYVHHRWQGLGAGGALMSRLVVESRRLGSTRLQAQVSVTARPFFTAMGFRPVRSQKRFYRGARFAQTLMARYVR